jgi:hypothetical protein
MTKTIQPQEPFCEQECEDDNCVSGSRGWVCRIHLPFEYNAAEIQILLASGNNKAGQIGDQDPHLI